jgi:hypothetical protein
MLLSERQFPLLQNDFQFSKVSVSAMQTLKFYKMQPPTRFQKMQYPTPFCFCSLRKRLLASHCVLEIGTRAVELLLSSRTKQYDSGTQTFLFRRVDIQINIKNTYNDHGGASSFSMALVNQHFHEKIEKNS